MSTLKSVCRFQSPNKFVKSEEVNLHQENRLQHICNLIVTAIFEEGPNSKLYGPPMEISDFKRSDNGGAVRAKKKPSLNQDKPDGI